MSQGDEVERYLKDPSLLIKLCREVIERLVTGSNNGKTVEMEKQLREIARSIDKLEKQGVPVPDALRGEKTRLAVTLSVSAEATQTLNHLTNELKDLLNELMNRIGRNPDPTTLRKPRGKRSKSPKTDKLILRQLIIKALQHFGGSASKNDVLMFMEEKLNGKLLPGDLEWRQSTNDYVWQNNACWERYSMTQDGTLKIGSPRGVWELREATDEIH